MDILKISGILDEKCKIIENEILIAKHEINHLIEILENHSELIEDIEFLTEDEQTVKSVMTGLNYISNEMRKHVNKYKSFYRKKTMKVASTGLKSSSISWTYKDDIIDTFNKIIDHFKTITDEFHSKIPADATAGRTPVERTPVERTPISKEVKTVKIKLSGGTEVILNVKASDMLKTSKTKKSLKIGTDTQITTTDGKFEV